MELVYLFRQHTQTRGIDCPTAQPSSGCGDIWILTNIANYEFFRLINNYLRDEIAIFQWELLQRTTAWWGWCP